VSRPYSTVSMSSATVCDLPVGPHCSLTLQSPTVLPSNVFSLPSYVRPLVPRWPRPPTCFPSLHPLTPLSPRVLTVPPLSTLTAS